LHPAAIGGARPLRRRRGAEGQHPQELGCIRENELLARDLDDQDFKRLPREDEAVVLHSV